MASEIVVSLVTAVVVIAAAGVFVYFLKPSELRVSGPGMELLAKFEARIEHQEARIGEQRDELEHQREALEALSEKQLLFAALVTGAEAKHLRLLRAGADDHYRNHRGLRDELRSLVGRGLVRKTTEGLVHELPASFSPAEHFALTELGELMLDLRERYSVEDRVVDGEP